MRAPSWLQVLDSWWIDPGLTLALGTSAALYLAAVRRGGRGWPAIRTAAFIAGLLAIALALESGLDGYAERLLSIHMVQHLVLILLAAPLLLAGRPVTLALRALPSGPRQDLAGWLRGPAGRLLSHPLTGLLALACSMLVTHLTPLFELALERPLIHFGEHILYLLGGLLFWAVLIHPGPAVRRLDGLGQVVYLLLGMPLMSVVGVILETDAAPRYTWYLTPAREMGVSALADQRLAGALMWIAGTTAMGAIALSVAWRSIVVEEDRAQTRETYAERNVETNGELRRDRSDRTGRASMRQRMAGKRRGAMLTVAVVLGALGLTGIAEGDRRVPTPSYPPSVSAVANSVGGIVEQGRSLFVKGCSYCHGMTAHGIPGRAPSLVGVGAQAPDFYLSTGRMPLPDPHAYPERSKPAYPRPQIDALIAYIARLGGPAIPAINVKEGNLSEGEQAFALHCAGCHQIIARGGIVTGSVAPPLQQATATEIAEAVRIGPYLMPRFSVGEINQQTLNSIARYITYTRHPADRGGWGIGHIGPIPEGMVAWLLALSSLLIIARVIGERIRE